MPEVSWVEFLRVFREPTFRPTDCPNFLTYADEAQYRWYARLLAPLLVATGGGPHFIGNHVETLSGSKPCDTWMVVRYRSHRHMMGMIASPYYLFVNRFRERGTARLELAFTQPSDPESPLRSARHVLVVHADGIVPERLFASLRSLPRPPGVEVVYESVSRLDFSFLRNPRACDPNPLTYPLTFAFGASDEASLRAFAAAPALLQAIARAPRAALALYRRGSVRQYL